MPPRPIGKTSVPASRRVLVSIVVMSTTFPPGGPGKPLPPLYPRLARLHPSGVGSTHAPARAGQPQARAEDPERPEVQGEAPARDGDPAVGRDDRGEAQARPGRRPALVVHQEHRRLRELGLALLGRPDVLRRDVVAQALVRGLAQRVRVGDLGEVDDGHEPRLDEARLLRRLPAGERAVLAREAVEELADARELRLAEPAADAPGVAQLAVLVEAHHERTEAAGAALLTRQPAADHDVRVADVLDLQPALRAAAGHVRAVEPLGDDALEPLGARGLEQACAVSDVVRRGLPRRAAP